MSDSGYLLAGQASEVERLQLQSRVWEPAGRALLSQLGSGDGLSALDVGCGCFGWSRGTGSKSCGGSPRPRSRSRAAGARRSP